MPHLIIEYSASLEDKVDIAAFCEAMRDAIFTAPGDFPLGGTRVRAYRADHSVVADGGAHDFMHLMFRIGAGRDLAIKRAASKALYVAAEDFMKPLIGDGSIALSLELVEMDADTSIKRWNTVRDHLP